MGRGGGGGGGGMVLDGNCPGGNCPVPVVAENVIKSY